MFTLIIWYQDGTTEKATYKTEAEARNAEKGYYKAFGGQIAGSTIKRGTT
jgi:hypothetical protein